MAIVITSGSISFDGQEFKKGDVTASKDFERKRKSDDGIPLKRLRAFESASTFIDFNTDRRGQRKGQSIDVFVKDTFEALHIDPLLVSIGPKSNIALELTGSIKTNSQNIQLNSATTMSISASVSSISVEEMSMDIDAGGFFGIAVSGSTTAANIANMASIIMNFQQSGSTTFQGGDTTVSQSANNNFEVSGGNTNFNTNVNVDVTDPTSSFDISGSGDTVTFEVSGGNTNFNTNVNVDVTDPTSSFDISGSGNTTTFEVSGGNTNFNTNVNVDVTNASSSFDISGSGNTTTFEVSGGNTVINSEFTQSGPAVFEGGTNIFTSDSGSLPSGFVSGSEPTGSSEVVVEGDIEVSGSIIENYTNNVPISASILLTTALHGQGRQLFVRSGSAAIDAASGQGAMPSGLPVGNGIYTNTTPAGDMVITLPSASVGMSFYIINHNSPSNVAPFIGNQYGPSLHVHPSGSQRFAFSADGDPGVAGKAIINHSGSMQTGDFIKVYCISSTAPQWMIFQTGGTWTDEA